MIFNCQANPARRELPCGRFYLRARHHAAGRAFTLVEILIVVVILAILAALVMPQFSNASYIARENALKDDLRYFRTQIGVYKAQHEDVGPGHPNGDASQTVEAEWFVKHLTGYTNKRGVYSATASPDYPFGPYLMRIPVNPINGRDGVWIYAGGTDMPDPDASIDAGWIYNPLTHSIIANLPGNDSNGVPYVDY